MKERFQRLLLLLTAGLLIFLLGVAVGRGLADPVTITQSGPL